MLISFTVLTGERRGWQDIMRLASAAALAQFVLLLFAFSILIFCFLSSDFSLIYVAQRGHSLLPWELKLAAAWGGHEGSLLLWVLFLCGWGALFARRYRDEPDALFPRTLGILSLISALLLLFIVIWSDPFARIFPPAIAGRDLNPMLQHPGLIFHPPLLYLGYAALMVAASVALASLTCGGFSAAAAWVCWRWALPGWCSLTLGIILGSWWAYCELGWGGWWFWDPVENAALLPWLSASALLHSLYASRQRGIFRHWSLTLAIVTPILSLLGTLIVRSGILLSVHAFALDNVRAIPLFALFSILSLASLALYGWRARDDRPAARFSGGSREMLLLAALLLFCAVLLIVLIGTLYPMIYGLLGGGRLSVGAPYFNLATLPFALLMLAVMGIAAGGFWKRPPETSLHRRAWPLAIGLLTAALCRSSGAAEALACGLAAAVTLRLWLQPARALRRQLPALLAHGGVLIVAAGIIVSASSRQEISLNLSPGQRVDLAGYVFRFERLDLEARENYTTEKALISLWQGEKRIASLRPGAVSMRRVASR